MVEVLALEEFQSWFAALDENEVELVVFSIDLLREKGVALAHPYSSAIKGSRNALRELRVQAGKGPLRVLYAFDPMRRSVLILGGDKTNDDKFYETAVKKADALWDAYLDVVAKEKAAMEAKVQNVKKTKKGGKKR